MGNEPIEEQDPGTQEGGETAERARGSEVPLRLRKSHRVWVVERDRLRRELERARRGSDPENRKPDTVVR